ncbi:hypothetical protein SAMN05421847_0358 [Halpernia humi]|uniref:Uncharacterized protein n=1 Tax=Halpernia humi TaxID=493375 RepID=A0A1H5T3Z4_9FLAO|nr:hypothetical protein [Halpernia humi]SEF57506.1 hypothetical protein SAMN05421847_0358 [Halpernia humi]
MNKNFINLKEELLRKGFSERNFDYLYNAVKSGKNREVIFKNLTSDVRKVEPSMATEALDKIFEINGGEFKYENRNGYMYSIAYAIVAVLSLLMIIAYLNGSFIKLKLFIAAIAGFFIFSYKFVTTLYKSSRGKYRGE